MSFLTPSTSKRDRDSGTPAAASNTKPLLDRLAAVLPHGCKFSIYHLSTPPTKTEALCSAPPKERPDKTFCEKHFLAIAVDPTPQANVSATAKRSSPGADDPKEAEPRKQVLVFAVEIFVFTTAYQTTFFVSKADSTGYLQRLKLPPGTPSPIRELTSTFLAYLLEHRRRRSIQTVVNLFARAQAQYLFPGSSDNSGKHVLDDWGLVRWWCRVLNPLLEGPQSSKNKEGGEKGQTPWGSTKGYLIVPGLEETEMRAFIPRTASSAASWVIGHPMERISHYTSEFDWVPPRCLIPRYPDDPKSRFRGELDEEASKWKQSMGSWKSVKTLAQFWEMMAFRQECSSGRLTGFIWLVFDPQEDVDTLNNTSAASSTATTVNPITPSASFDNSLPSSSNPPSTPPRRRVADMSAQTPRSSPLKLALVSSIPSKAITVPAEAQEKPKKRKKKLTGPITPRLPKVKTHQRSYLPGNRPTTTAYYYWPLEGRGEKVVDEDDFKRIVELLLHLDFSDIEKATSSTRRWISEGAMGVRWGQDVVGRRVAPLKSLEIGAGGQVKNLTGMLEKVTEATGNGQVNVLGTGLIRKKAKPEQAVGPALEPTVSPELAPGSVAPAINVLGAGLVRKKKKPEPAPEAVGSEPS
ncbi:histone acetylation protein-domain-containing protein [Bombardia bombarda]|uniref:histone acetyltransferase n=1 Tax=Bombardia bombarda TaxID=252184 RepID=A0AA39W3T2_9PEZI|nr:histone acetylation protein-domain-containing protein [Bombardia bombarda]